MTSEDFTGRVAIVTGASSGIGRATAELFAQRGASVTAFARRADRLNELKSERVHVVSGDAGDPLDIERLFSETEARFGACDILVNNAGMIVPNRIEDISVDEWDRVFAVNVRAAFLASKRAIRSMMSRRTGTIINVSSISGVPGTQKFSGTSSYNATKGALISFTEALAVDVKEYGIRVNCVSPGSVDTPMWDEVSGGAPAAMTPQEVADVIAFLASGGSRPINGQNLHVFSA
jgi:3-oxoacyl-[acyl-carrier protein] reductase